MASTLYNILSSFWRGRSAINIPPVKTHEIETAHERPARSLKHLLKLNHVNNAVLWNQRRFHNHAPHVLSSSYLLGADQHVLYQVYEAEAKELEPWTDSPSEVSAYDWRDYLGYRQYERAFVDFFEDELVRRAYVWEDVVHHFLFSGDEPIFNSIIADLGHPLIHLAYAFEMSSREIAMEALALTATCYGDIHKYIDDPSYSLAEPSYRSNSLFEILNRVRSDKRFDGLFGTPGDDNLDIVFRDREAALLDHWNAWNIQNPTAQFRESQDLAAALLVATHTTDKYDFFFVHVLTTSHAIRVLLPLIPARFQIPLVRQWWLVTVAIYISQLRPEIDLDRIKSYELNGRDWDWAAGKAVKGDYYTDAHYVKAIRAFGEAARTWGDPEKRYLKAAVKFAEEFDGWGGFV